jgi:hypothetical protein
MEYGDSHANRAPSGGPFSVRIDASFKVGELGALARHSPVTRTSHLGNQCPADLAVCSLGVPARQVDKNYSVIDVLYRPEARVMDGRVTRLCTQSGILAPFLEDPAGRSLAFEHLDSFKRAVPNARISTYSLDYMKAIDLIEPVLQVLADVSPEVFDRSTRADGTVARLCAVDERRVCFGDPATGSVEIEIDRRELVPRAIGYFERAATALLKAIPVTDSGQILVKADADILLQAIMDAVAAAPGARQRVYQCCGVAMASYAADPRLDKPGKIAHLYGQVRRKLAKLPDIELVLIPTTWLRLAYLEPRQYAVHEEILALERELSRLDGGRGQAVRQAKSAEQQREAIDRFQASSLVVHQRRQELIRELTAGVHTPFYSPARSACFSQYDVLAREARVRIPADVLDMSLRDVRVRIKRLLKKFPAVHKAVFP